MGINKENSLKIKKKILMFKRLMKEKLIQRINNLSMTKKVKYKNLPKK